MGYVKKGRKAEWVGKKLELLEKMLRDGSTLQVCADYFNVSKARIGQVIRLHFPNIDKREIGKRAQVENRREAQREYILKTYGRDSFRHGTDLERAFSRAFTRKRQNCRRVTSRSPWEFTVKITDIEFNTHCPVLGIPLDWFSDERSENSPSFDRIDPKKGYIPGNVAVISWRANRIKNDGTAEEHSLISAWMASTLEQDLLVKA